jgi:hypothetical protein
MAKLSAKDKKYIKTRNQIFPQFKDEDYWSIASDGWKNTPRVLPYFLSIMDESSPVNPVSKVYLALWMRSFETYFIQGVDLDVLAIESGLNNERSRSQLKSKLDVLQELGFIAHHDYKTIALPSPYTAIGKLEEAGKVPQRLKVPMTIRLAEVGDETFESIHPPKAGENK